MKKLMIFLLLLASSLHAEPLPLPTSVLSVDDIVQEFRSVLATKMIDLGKNYISTFSESAVRFTNYTNLNCNGNIIQAGESAAEIVYSYKKNNNRLDEKIIYKGCAGDISLVEEISTTGEEVKPTSIVDIVKVKRSFALSENEASRIYRLTNGDGEELFKVSLNKTSNSKASEIYFILGQNFLNMNYYFSEAETLLGTTFVGYTANYVRKYSKWRFRNDFIPYTYLVKSTVKGELREIDYFDNESKRISMTNYVDNFHSNILDGTISNLSDIIDYHMAYFPKTTATKTGAQSQRMLEELRIAFNRLLTNTELNLVKNLIQEYMNATENGQIIDNRPRETNK